VGGGHLHVAPALEHAAVEGFGDVPGGLGQFGGGAVPQALGGGAAGEQAGGGHGAEGQGAHRAGQHRPHPWPFGWPGRGRAGGGVDRRCGQWCGGEAVAADRQRVFPVRGNATRRLTWWAASGPRAVG
jgi:hypothetical protein